MSKRNRKSQRSRQGRPRSEQNKPARKNNKMLLIGCTVAAVVAAAVLWSIMGGDSGASKGPDINLPQFSAQGQRGARAFESNCSKCHGVNASGSDKGPSLVNRIYEPSHHGDNAIRRAARLGVRPHHWRFGPMPKIDVPDRALNDIIIYIRELQRANGIG